MPLTGIWKASAAVPPVRGRHYLHEARCFLVDVFPDLKTNWAALNADHVAGFVLRRAEKLSGLSQQGPVTAIRSLLRFLAFEGQIRVGL
jgi:hypothetical protein